MYLKILFQCLRHYCHVRIVNNAEWTTNAQACRLYTQNAKIKMNIQNIVARYQSLYTKLLQEPEQYARKNLSLLIDG